MEGNRTYGFSLSLTLPVLTRLGVGFALPVLVGLGVGLASPILTASDRLLKK